MMECPEVLAADEYGSVTPRISDNCKSTMPAHAAERVAAEVRTVPNLKWLLNRQIADLDQKIRNARQLSNEAERLKKQIREAQ